MRLRKNRSTALFGLAFLFYLLALAPSAFAHPHMSLSSQAEFVWKGDKLSGAYLTWTFDDFFSADIIRSSDKNHDGVFSPAESKNVYATAFQNLKNYHYFVFIRQGDKRSNPAGVSDFVASQDHGRLVYRFFIDLSNYGQELYLAVYDYTYFCAISYPDKDPVSFQYDAAAVSPRYEIVENKKYPVYYNPLGAADDTTVYYKWKKGLMTYYPQEIHVYAEKPTPSAGN
jgi:ABC-type uncharacterized transport system substrate-binding protein